LLIIRRRKDWMATLSRHYLNAVTNNLIHNFIVMFDWLKQERTHPGVTIWWWETLNFSARLWSRRAVDSWLRCDLGRFINNIL
jgi:hypothetical protein